MPHAIQITLALLAILLPATRPAHASVDLTGAFTVTAQSIVGPIKMAFEFVQTGTQLDLTYTFPNNPPSGPFTGTIDPDSGVFTIPLPNSGSPISCSGNEISGTASADGQSISGVWHAYFDDIHLFCEDGGGTFEGPRNVCGDGVVAGGEACDNPGSTCCSADCSTETPDGTTCDDGNPCTLGDHCSNGSCVLTSELSCQPCESCSPGGCIVTEDAGCQPVLAGGKSTISLRHDAGTPEKDALRWNWKNGAPTSVADFGTPAGGTSFFVCVIDQTGGVPTVRMSRLIPSCTGPSGTCWKSVKSGFVYKSKDGLPNGITAATLAAGSTGHGKLKIKGKGAALAAEAGFTSPVTVRLVREDVPICWDAKYSTPKTNDGVIFKAKSD